MKRVFISDCEGPISKNDNAFEMTAHFIPNGDRLFTVISRYDDVLAEILKRADYTAGGTLKFILPFFKAYEVTDRKMQEFSAQNLVLMANSKDTLQHVRSIAPAFIVSTSYEHYIKALCQALGFLYENTYCTRLSIDKYSIGEEEKTKLKKIAEQIAQMPIIEIPSLAKSLRDFSEKDQETFQRLDAIFWEEMADMEAARFFSEVNPVGGSQKADAVKDAVKREDTSLAGAMYVGDSITDEEAFKLVKENRGLTVSFNGNRYAIKNAEIAVLSENSVVTAIIGDLFCRFGRQRTLDIVQSWNRQILDRSPVNRNLLSRLFALYPSGLPKVKIITRENMEILAEESSEFRKKARGEAVGRLG